MLYGINAHVPTVDDVQRAAELGVKAIRVDFNWWQIQPSPTHFTLSHLLPALNRAEDLGITVLGVLAYTPNWATRKQSIEYPPDNLQDWEDFLVQVFTACKGLVAHWAIWNEPNLKQFFRGDMDDYADLVWAADRARKTCGFPVSLVGPNLSTGGKSNWAKWADRFIRGTHYFNVCSFHIYEPSIGEVLERIEKGKHHKWFRWLHWLVRDWRPIDYYLRRSGLAIWITETGWTANRPKDEPGQAKNYSGLPLLQQHVNGVFTYELADDPWIDKKWGIYRADRTPKAAVSAYSKVTS